MTALPAVLVVCGGGFQGLAGVRLLAESDRFRIIVADWREQGVTLPFVDRFRRVPPVAEAAGFVAAIVALCRDERVALVLPSTDHELEALAAARAAIEATGARLGVCDAELLAVLRDKAVLAEALAAAGLPVLPARPPAAGELPLVGKPRRGWGSRGLVIARDRQALEAVPPECRAELMWQELLEEAEELSVDFAIGFDGSPSRFGMRRRLLTSGGFAVVSESVEDVAAESVMRGFAAWASSRGGRGLFNVQLLRPGERLVISDVNPRLGTSATHWRGSGFNPATWLCANLRLAAEGAGAGPPPSRRSVRHLEDLVFERPATGAPVAGIVFDLDDTLVHTSRWLRARLELAIERFLPPAEQPRARRHGWRLVDEGPRDRLIDALAESLGWDLPRRDAFLAAYRESWPAGCEPFAEVRPALATLRGRGLSLAVLTDNPPATQRRKMEASGLGPLLDAVVFSRDWGAEKPDPRAFAAAAAALGLPAGRLAMVGDNPHRDLCGAAEAGYARLFLLRRGAALRGFDAESWAGLPGSERFEPVADLRDLGARLVVPER